MSQSTMFDDLDDDDAGDADDDAPASIMGCTRSRLYRHCHKATRREKPGPKCKPRA